MILKTDHSEVSNGTLESDEALAAAADEWAIRRTRRSYTDKYKQALVSLNDALPRKQRGVLVDATGMPFTYMSTWRKQIHKALPTPHEALQDILQTKNVPLSAKQLQDVVRICINELQAELVQPTQSAYHIDLHTDQNTVVPDIPEQANGHTDNTHADLIVYAERLRELADQIDDPTISSALDSLEQSAGITKDTTRELSEGEYTGYSEQTARCLLSLAQALPEKQQLSFLRTMGMQPQEVEEWKEDVGDSLYTEPHTAVAVLLNANIRLSVEQLQIALRTYFLSLIDEHVTQVQSTLATLQEHRKDGADTTEIVMPKDGVEYAALLQKAYQQLPIHRPFPQRPRPKYKPKKKKNISTSSGSKQKGKRGRPRKHDALNPDQYKDEDSFEAIKLYLEQAGQAKFLTLDEIWDTGEAIEAARNAWQNRMRESSFVRSAVQHEYETFYETPKCRGPIKGVSKRIDADRIHGDLSTHIEDMRRVTKTGENIETLNTVCNEEVPMKDEWYRERSKQMYSLEREMEHCAVMGEEGQERLKALEQTVGEPYALFTEHCAAIRELEEKWRAEKKKMVDPHIRLVVDIAKKYRKRGVGFLDLIQQGNIGLMKAVEMFEYERGYKFTTYSTWWIRQEISRYVREHKKNVRLPSHIQDMQNKIRTATRDLTVTLGREPTLDEIARHLELDVEEVEEVLMRTSREVSIDAPSGDNEDAAAKVTFMEDTSTSERDEQEHEQLSQLLLEMIGDLQEEYPREARVVLRRYGLLDGETQTLKQVGEEEGVTRERIRQVEGKFIKRLQAHPKIDSLALFLKKKQEVDE